MDLDKRVRVEVANRASNEILGEQVAWACNEIVNLRDQVAILNKCNQECTNRIADLQG